MGVLTSSRGIMYGTTSSGGENEDGALFTAAVSGKVTILYSFLGGNGKAPQGALVVGKGVVYGTTENGGGQNIGTVYAIGPGSVEEVLHTFRGGSDGSFPLSGLTNYRQRFYGLTNLGGGQGFGELF